MKRSLQYLNLLTVAIAFIATNVFLSSGISAQDMVKDIYPGPSYTNSNPYNLTNVNGTLFMKASDYTHGIELWKSDGSDAGTILITDICDSSMYGINPGSLGPNTTSDLTAVNGIVFFTAIDCASQYNLWKSDGTEAGTVKVMTDYADTVIRNPKNMINVNGTLFFTCTGGGFNEGVWKSDGTPSGTVFLKDIKSGNHSTYEYFYSANGILYFVGDDGTNGKELWKSDGTTSGTVMVKDINTGPNVGAFSGSPNFTELNGMVYFSANDGTNNGGLWKTDGTNAGTVMVKDVPTNSMVNINGTLFLSVNRTVSELWKSDGTTAGTVMVRDSVYFETASTAIVNGTLFFVGYDDTHGYELWKSDGTDAGTGMVKDINPGTGLRPNSAIQYMTSYNGACYFSADDGTNGQELWKSDGTEAGTMMVSDINSTCATFCGGTPSYLKVVNGVLYFNANDGVHGQELWKLAGTTSVREISSVTPQEFSLQQNYPNPFNPTTTFEFSIVQSGFVSLKIYNVLGEEIVTLVQENMFSGTYAATWDADGFASGMYFCRLQAGGKIQTRSMILLK